MQHLHVKFLWTYYNIILELIYIFLKNILKYKLCTNMLYNDSYLFILLETEE